MHELWSEELHEAWSCPSGFAPIERPCIENGEQNPWHLERAGMQ